MAEVSCGFIDDQHRTGSGHLIFFGPTIQVQVGFDPAFVYDPTSTAAPAIEAKTFHALVDTGAYASCIDAGLAMQLNLPIVDRQKVAGVHGVHEVNMHVAQIYVPDLHFTIYGQFAGVDLVAGGQAHHVLIGRTFLRHFKMEYSGVDGTVTIKSP